MAVSVVIDVTGHSLLRGGAQLYAVLGGARLRRRRRRLFCRLRTDELLWLGTAYTADHGI